MFDIIPYENWITLDAVQQRDLYCRIIIAANAEIEKLQSHRKHPAECDEDITFTKLWEEHLKLKQQLAEVEKKLNETNRFMDDVRDAARNRHPDGCTALDFFAVWNEQYSDKIKLLESKLTAADDRYEDLDEQFKYFRNNANERIADLEAQLAAAEKQNDSDYHEAAYLFSLCAPQCNALPNTSGVLSQLSNYIAGLTQQLAAAEAERDKAQKKDIHLSWKSTAQNLQRQLAEAEKERDEAREAARWLRSALTNMSHEKVQRVYQKWPWLKEVGDE